jgi:SAM-dependent methyltransferase
LDKPWEQPIANATEKTIMALIENPENSRLLDFGAGFGRYLNMFTKYFKRDNLYGAEIDDESLNILQTRGYNCYKPDFHNPDIPFEDNYFDYIFSSNVIEHIPNKYYKLYLREFWRTLKPGGRLIIGTPNYPFKRLYDFKKAFQTKMYRYYFLDDPTHCNKLSIRKLEKDLREVFPLVALEPTYIFFQDKLNFIKKNRNIFKVFCDKIFGYCDKR